MASPQQNPNNQPPFPPQNFMNLYPQQAPAYHFAGEACGSSTSATQPLMMAPSPELSVPESSDGARTSERRRKRSASGPVYDTNWWRFYEVTNDANGALHSAKCKVRNCNFFCEYRMVNDLNAFKEHAYRHMRDRTEPEPDGHVVQKYNEKVMLSEFVQYVAHKEQPVSTGSCSSFARLIIRGCGQSLYKRLNHRKVLKELKEQYTARKNEIVSQFSVANHKVSIAFEFWTAGKHGPGHSFITAHYIDESWALQRKVLSFRTMEFPYTAQVVYQSIVTVLQEYNLKTDEENKIFSISFDNTSNDIKSIDCFTQSLNPIMNGTMFYHKCACHFLNLTVKKVIKTPSINNLITKFKNGLHHIYSNSIRKQDFHALCSRLGLSKLRVPWGVDTRWNSIYRILHRCVPYKHAISETLRNSSEGIELVLSVEEWDQIEILKQFLEAFFKATVGLCCSSTPSAHALFRHLFLISKLYREMKGNLDSARQCIVEAIRDEFLQHWEDVPVATIIANCLHPAYKKKYTVRLLQRYKDNLGLQSDMEEARVTSAVEEMFIIYNARRNANQPSSTDRNTGSNLLELLQEGEDWQVHEANRTELAGYYLGGLEHEDTDVLDFWRRAACAYPTLATMARDVFSVPMSTVPSESCFANSSNKIITDKRCRLGSKTFERLVCLKDWIDAENRVQHDPAEATTSGGKSHDTGTKADDDSDSGI